MENVISEFLKSLNIELHASINSKKLPNGFQFIVGHESITYYPSTGTYAKQSRKEKTIVKHKAGKHEFKELLIESGYAYPVVLQKVFFESEVSNLPELKTNIICNDHSSSSSQLNFDTANCFNALGRKTEKLTEDDIDFIFKLRDLIKTHY